MSRWVDVSVGVGVGVRVEGGVATALHDARTALPRPLFPQLTSPHTHNTHTDDTTRPQIHHTHALLLVLGSPAYLDAKMSSTIVTSLMTGVPVVADESFLKAYTFLAREDVFLMKKGEDEVDAMLRVSLCWWSLWGEMTEES
jgi:hypothetical protein